MGIDPVLVTCDADNLASRKVIEANGGVLDDERRGKLRFWVPTGPPGGAVSGGPGGAVSGGPGERGQRRAG